MAASTNAHYQYGMYSKTTNVAMSAVTWFQMTLLRLVGCFSESQDQLSMAGSLSTCLFACA